MQDTVNTAVEKFRFIVHVGMGKTGSSSIQQVLDDNQSNLEQQSVRYIGAWLEDIDQKFKGFEGDEVFRSMPVSERVAAADTFYGLLERWASETGTRTFVLCNESWSSYPYHVAPFLERLADLGVQLDVLCYVRRPEN